MKCSQREEARFYWVSAKRSETPLHMITKMCDAKDKLEDDASLNASSNGVEKVGKGNFGWVGRSIMSGSILDKLNDVLADAKLQDGR